MKATAEAGANIALIKYWGRRDEKLNLPLTDSVSLTLDKLTTRTTVEFDPALKADALAINGKAQSGASLERVARVMDHVRKRANVAHFARVSSENSFAAAAGMASSASAFAALPAAAFAALGVSIDPKELSTFARLGSGSACRSVFGGFVEWVAADTHAGSYAQPLPAAQTLDLHDVVLMFSGEEKAVKSAEGHAFAKTSPFNAARVSAVETLLPRLKRAIQHGDLTTLGEISERDALLMHGVMMTSVPSLVYWKPETVAGILGVRQWREEGLQCYFTIDAGPNLHVLCQGKDAQAVAKRAREAFDLDASRVVVCPPGEGVRLLQAHVA